MPSSLRSALVLNFERLLRISPESKPKVYLQVFDGADLANLNYWLEILLSAGIATLGLVLSSPAVVIGAMLVSPLMGPIIALGMALAASDLYLGIKSGAQLALSIIAAVAFAALLVFLLPFHSATPEILARTQPNLLDLFVALFSGLAGSLVVSRSQSPEGGGVGALPGVAIAVALMPPLCVVGFGVGIGFHGPTMYGAGLLFFTNLAAIVATAFLVFYLIRMDTEDVRLSTAAGLLERASHDSVYRFLERQTFLSRAFKNVGTLRSRILMLGAILIIVFVPLTRSLVQLRNEAIVRDAVHQAEQVLLQEPGQDIILERIANIPKVEEPLVVRLVVTNPVGDALIEQAEGLIEGRTGRREVQLIVRQVTGVEEAALLAAPQGAASSLESIRADMIAQIRRPIEQLWPASSGCLQDYSIGFTPSSIVVRIRYSADESFNETSRLLFQSGLRDALASDAIEVVMENESAPLTDD